jgi:hypothetical protein
LVFSCFSGVFVSFWTVWGFLVGAFGRFGCAWFVVSCYVGVMWVVGLVVGLLLVVRFVEIFVVVVIYNVLCSKNYTNHRA